MVDDIEHQTIEVDHTDWDRIDRRFTTVFHPTGVVSRYSTLFESISLAVASMGIGHCPLLSHQRSTLNPSTSLPSMSGMIPRRWKLQSKICEWRSLYSRTARQSTSIREVNCKFWLVLHIWSEADAVVVNVVMFVKKISSQSWYTCILCSSARMDIWTWRSILTNLEKHSIHRFMNEQHRKQRWRLRLWL